MRDKKVRRKMQLPQDDPSMPVMDLDFEEADDSISLDYSVAQNGSHRHPPVIPPAELDELDASGSTPDPESDDDTLENAHRMGLQLGEDEEHPKELDIAGDIDEAEEYIRTH